MWNCHIRPFSKSSKRVEVAGELSYCRNRFTRHFQHCDCVQWCNKWSLKWFSALTETRRFLINFPGPTLVSCYNMQYMHSNIWKIFEACQWNRKIYRVWHAIWLSTMGSILNYNNHNFLKIKNLTCFVKWKEKLSFYRKLKEKCNYFQKQWYENIYIYPINSKYK